jgi:23S rRNA pseudouridine955/2504/2580 synthase
MFLHAQRIEFEHPVDGKPIAVEAPLPVDLAEFLAQLDAAKDGGS